MELDSLIKHEYLVKVINKNNLKIDLTNSKGYYVGANSISEAKQIVEKSCPKPRYQVIEVIPIR